MSRRISFSTPHYDSLGRVAGRRAEYQLDAAFPDAPEQRVSVGTVDLSDLYSSFAPHEIAPVRRNFLGLYTQVHEQVLGAKADMLSTTR